MDVDVDGCVIGFSVRLICFCFQVEGDVEVVHYIYINVPLRRPTKKITIRVTGANFFILHFFEDVIMNSSV